MAFPASVARVALQFTLANGSAGYVVMHTVQSDGSDYSQAELDGLVVQFDDWWSDDNFQGNTNQALRDNISVNVSLASITATSLAAVAPIQSQLAVAQAGAVAGNPVPNESAIVVTLYTGFIGRSYRGRNFWPGLPVASMQGDGTIAAATTAQLQATFDALVAGLESGTNSELAVYSPTLDIVTPVASALVRDTLHHQSRRNS